VDSIMYYFVDFADYDAKAAAKALKKPALEPLQLLHARLAQLQSWTTVDIHAVIEGITQELEVGMGKVGQPLRVAVTGGSFSPPIDQTVELLGKARSIARIERAIDFISAKEMQ
jgi:glutamyl-tRNA synthetase